MLKQANVFVTVFTVCDLLCTSCDLLGLKKIKSKEKSHTPTVIEDKR